jgi:hypothetical protein
MAENSNNVRTPTNVRKAIDERSSNTGSTFDRRGDTFLEFPMMDINTIQESNFNMSTPSSLPEEVEKDGAFAWKCTNEEEEDT